MSSTTNTPYMTKSMNGVIVISDGAGVTIENGVITAPTIDLTNLNIDEIQGTAPINNIDLYTNSLGSIDLGAATTAIVNINATDTNILAANSLYMNSGTTTSILASTINLVSNEIVVGGGQTIYQNDLSQDFTIGGNATTRNFYLGNLVVPPQIPYAATMGFDAVNYDTCVALIGSGGTGQLYADDIYTFTPGAFSSLWSDNTAGIAIGANSILNTASQSMGTNNGSLALATISNRSADTFIATGQNHSGNIYLGSGQNSTGNIFIACNNYTGPSGSTTSGVYIGGASTSTAFNGQINIAAFAPAAGTNSMIIGSTSTTMIIRCASVNIANSTPSAAPVNICSGTAYSGTLNICNGTSQTSTCNIGANATTGGNNFISIGNNNTTLNLCTTTGIGGTQTILYGQAQTTHTHTGTQINLNSGNGTANTVSVGSLATTTLTDVAQTINVNSTNGNSNTVNIGSSTSTINAYPIKPALTTYNATTGTNVVGSIGYIYRGSANTGSLPNTSLQIHGTITDVPKGVYYVSASICVNCSAAGQIYYQQYTLDLGNGISDVFAESGIAVGTAPGNCVVRDYFGNVTGVTSLTATTTLRVRTFWNFSGGTFSRSSLNFTFTAVRIA